MRIEVDYAQRAEECRRLAELASKPEDWGHFSEMAETWDRLGKLQESNRRLKSAGILKTKIPAAVLRIEDAVRDLEKDTPDQNSLGAAFD
jgi:hypothetical protein